jgi:hypothetical protein
MTPSENIYRSDADMVDGLLDVEQFAEDFTNDSIDTLRDMVDDGQPTMYEEYQDLYSGDDYIGDMYMDTIDYPEDWG